MNFPPYGTTVSWDTAPGWGHPAEVVPVMSRLARQDASDPTIRNWALRAIRNVARDDYSGEAHALCRAALRDIRYTLDPPGHEYLQAPRLTLKIGAGDCDDIADLLAAAIWSIGRAFRFHVVARQPNHPIHVWAEMWSPEGWITIDPVTKPPRIGVGAGVDGFVRSWDHEGRESKPMVEIDRYSDMAGFWAKLWGGIKKVAKVVGSIYPPVGAALAVAEGAEKAIRGATRGAGRAAGAVRGALPAAARAAGGGRPTIVDAAGRATRAGAVPVGRGARPAVAAAGGPRPTIVRGPAGARRPTAAGAPTPRMVRPPTGARGGAPAMVRGPGGLPPGAAPAAPAIQAFAAALQQRQAQRLIGAAQQAASIFSRFGLGQGAPHVGHPPTGYRPQPWTYYDVDTGIGRVRYQYSRHPAHHFAQPGGGAAMKGLGAAPSVRIADAATEAEIAAALPGQAALLAKTEAQPDGSTLTVGDIRTRARRVNYALSHLGEPNMGRRRVAERLMAFKKALGVDPVDSTINDALRGLLAAQGGILPGAVPTIDDLARKLPRGPGAAAGAGAPGAQAPGAQGTVPTQVVPPPGGGAAPVTPTPGAQGTVPTQVVPPPAGGVKGDATTWAIVAVVALAWLKRRRRGG